MREIKPRTLWTTAAIAVSVTPFITQSANATTLFTSIDPFNVDQIVLDVGALGSTLQSSETIDSLFLGSVTRTMSVAKTTGTVSPLMGLIDSSLEKLTFFAGAGANGSVLTDYGTFASVKDFTQAQQAEGLLLSLDSLSISSLGSSIPTPTLAVTFYFRDSDGTTGSLSQQFTGSLSGFTEFSLRFSDATLAGGGNGVLNFSEIAGFSYEINATGNAIFTGLFNPIGLSPSGPAFPGQDPTIPEPGTVLGLLTIGAFGIASRRGAREKS